jgi:hypothetical protein
MASGDGKQAAEAEPLELVLFQVVKCYRGASIHETKFCLTKISLFERLKLKAPLTKEGLKIVLRL